MNPIEPNNTCDIYRRYIEDLRTQGDTESLSEMVETWYSRCDFGTNFQGEAVSDLGVTSTGIVWMQTPAGFVQFCQERNRWRLIDVNEPGSCQYMMARIAEVTHVPFAYLCGVRDAVAIIDKVGRESFSEGIKKLAEEQKELAKDIRKKRIAVDSVVVELGQAGTKDCLRPERYPDAPAATLSWQDLRNHFRDSSGVYFAWNDGKVVYVGVTERGMFARLQSGHHAVTKSDRFSFIEMPSSEVYFAENVYISRYAPERNACVAQALGIRQGGHRGARKKPARKKACGHV